MAQKYFRFIKKLGKDRVKRNESMGLHTTFGIGGPADLFYEARTTEELIKVVLLCRKQKIPYFILGGGSNLLVSDEGVRGMVINVQSSKLKVQNKKIVVDAGVPLTKVVTVAAENLLSGLEFAVGIPGTMGGAIVGNAGTKDGTIAEVVDDVTILDPDGKVHNLLTKSCQFDYRRSRFQKSGEIILRATLELKKGKKEEIEAQMKDALAKRKNQPKERSAGSIFKNPPGKVAGWLIDQCGLKGKRIGDAQISPKHANFIVNLGKAKADDVVQLIKLAKKEVKRKFGIKLEEEIYLLGFDKI